MNKKIFPAIMAIAMPLCLALQSCALTNSGDKSSDKSSDKEYQLEAVDLGLSVKWANLNLGASVPEEYGDYYAWGETEAKNEYSDSLSNWYGIHNEIMLNHMKALEGAKIMNLTDSFDAARKNLGGNWRMPTKEEMDELCKNCDWTPTKQNGVKGFLVQSRTNSNSIFLPAAGGREGRGQINAGICAIYWTATAHQVHCNAYNLSANATRQKCQSSNRYYGFTIRPVTQ